MTTQIPPPNSIVTGPKEDKDPNNEKLPEELQKCLKELVSRCEKEDGFVRKQQVKIWKKNDEFWHGIQYVFWSESREEWVSPVDTTWFDQGEGREDAEGPFYDYVVNIYKAHGESIIAALSAQIPGVRFPPDDAEDGDDLVTSKTFSKIADLIQRHNEAKVALLQALFIMWNQGIIAAYHAPKADKAFGNLKVPRFKEGTECTECGYSSFNEGSDEEDKPEETNETKIPVGDISNENQQCPQCQGQTEPTSLLAGFDDAPKTRVIIDMFGPLHVKVPYYARVQKDFGYLICSLDQPKSLLKSLYPHVAEKINKDFTDPGQFERSARQPSAYSSFSKVDEDRDLAPLRRIWLRPWQLEGIPETKEKEKKKLKKLFPDGVYVCFIGDTYVEARNEDMDKYWTIGKSSLSQYIHCDALGQSLIPLQEIKNVLTNLTLETIEQAIPTTFADPATLNFDTYSKHEARPGMVYPARRKLGENLGNSFYESSRATLSQEVSEFNGELDKGAQFVVGSFPSLYGGPGEGKSRTASEYNMSRQMALQRLSICWTLLTKWWARLMEKCVHLYVENLVDDERYVIPGQGKEDYVNVWIRKSELNGKVGEVEPEGAETFPISTPAKQALFIKLLELKDQFLNAAIYDTQNRSVVSDLLAFPEFEIPGEDQRIKQIREIDEMLKLVPVPIEPGIDDDPIHISTLRHFLVGDKGMDVKKTNPKAYQLLMLHFQAHTNAQMQQMQQMQAQAQPIQQPAPEVE